jgi:uncharacterized protein YbjT (DUF2867 family)
MVIVTGAAGRTGGEVVRLLSARGIRVRALIRDPERTKGLKGPGVEVVVGDLRRPATLDPAFRGANKLFLVSSPDPEVETLHGNAIEAAKRAGIRQIVRLSARGAAQGISNILLRVHGDVDEHLSRSGLSFTILRPGGFFQNTLMHAPTVSAEGVIYGLSKDGANAMIDNRDVALAAAAVLTGTAHSGRIYELTGPEAITPAQIAEKLSAAIERPVRFEEIPVDQARVELRAMLPQWLADAYVDLTLAWATGKDGEVSDGFERVTGKKPRPYEQFARDFAGAFGGAPKSVAGGADRPAPVAG